MTESALGPPSRVCVKFSRFTQYDLQLSYLQLSHLADATVASRGVHVLQFSRYIGTY